jgi:hypothetical protein
MDTTFLLFWRSLRFGAFTLEGIRNPMLYPLELRALSGTRCNLRPKYRIATARLPGFRSGPEARDFE